jgi:hypothetical protein
MWPEQGQAYLGIVSTDGPSQPRGTVVVFHGNAGTAVSADTISMRLNPGVTMWCWPSIRAMAAGPAN